MDRLAKKLFGKFVGDKGYISQKLFERLWLGGVRLTLLEGGAI